MKDRIDRLEQAERDLERVEGERDALKAQQSAIRLALGAVKAAEDDESADRAVNNLAFIIEQEFSADHMTKLKAKWQADALKVFGNDWDWERMPNHKDIRHAAQRLRRQAEEDAG